MLFSRLKVSIRIWLLVVVSTLGLTVSGLVSLNALKTVMLADHREAVGNVVESAAGVVAGYAEKARSGEIPEAEAKARALAALRQMRYAGGEYIFVYSQDGTNLLNPGKPEVEGKNLLDVKDPNGVPLMRNLMAVAQAGKGEFTDYHWPKAGAAEPVRKTSTARMDPNWKWMIGSGIYLDEMEAEVASRTATLAGITLALILGTAALAAMIVRSIVKPLNVLTDGMHRIADHDLSVTVQGTDRVDEIGEMARALQVFKEAAIEKDRLEEERKQAEARLAAERRRAMLELANEFQSAVGEVVESVGQAAAEMEGVAESMAATAEEASRQSTAVAVGAEEASVNVQTVATATEELSASIKEISRQVTNSAQVAATAADEAEKSNAMVRQLAQAAERIGQVVTLITDIASQTNLLALNATIEAARAGEAGKGFAVVAGEVKALANQTTKATEEISSQINAIQEETRLTVTSIAGIAQTIAKVNEIASSIAAAIEEQGAATAEIARNVQQAAAGTDEVSQNISGVRTASAEAGQAASNVRTSAHDLSEQASVLRSEVGRFLAHVREG